MLDERTKKYFESIRKNLNYLGSNHGWDGIEEILKKKGVLEEANLKMIKGYDGYVNSSEIVVYTYYNKITKETRYCAQLSYRTDIDDYNVETHIFSKMPSLKDIHAIRAIEILEFKFKFGKDEPEFTCWECGRKTHWLDVEGDLQLKIERLEEQYCGC